MGRRPCGPLELADGSSVTLKQTKIDKRRTRRSMMLIDRQGDHTKSVVAVAKRQVRP